MTGVTVSYVNFFADGPVPRCTAHASIGDAASEIAAARGSGRSLGTLRVEIDAHGIVRSEPVDPASHTAPPPPSTRMLELIAEYRRRTAALDAIDFAERPRAWDAAAERRCRALDALLAERPGGVADHCAKYTALMSFLPEDCELVSLGILADEARDLAEAAGGVPARRSGRPGERGPRHSPKVHTGRNTPTMSDSRTGP
jgi:hypothetical protein